MLKVFCSILLISLTAKGSKETTCTARNWKTLQCNFPQNINTTRKDYAVYFHPYGGGEEKVVDCAWIDAQLHCIRQEGFDCSESVSDKAIIGVPERFVNREGSFRCNMNGYSPGNFSFCRFLANKGEEPFAACEASLANAESQVVLNCSFSVDVESFTVKKNTTVVASFTKSDCQRSSPICTHMPGDNHHIFSVTLDVEDFTHGEYKCHPEDPPPQLQVKGCSLNINKQTETSEFPVVAVVLIVVLVTALVSAGASLLIIRKLMMIKKAMLKKKEEEKIST
ncbi:uncharacterized protein LOC112567925 [Pomacea canaliculata]|uniref:uncharacterized protein LOC112567925 n=1 Tax=Pomacea canaliculata TaxID=400727 RepID=UPI000D728672|nr:uncharacterized protein LOC112567925 [Pomacea canaliculata]